MQTSAEIANCQQYFCNNPTLLGAGINPKWFIVELNLRNVNEAMIMFESSQGLNELLINPRAQKIVLSLKISENGQLQA